MEEGTVVRLPRPGASLEIGPQLAVPREGAKWMLAPAVEAEARAFPVAHADVVDRQGRRWLVRNDHAPERGSSRERADRAQVGPRARPR